MHRLLPGVEPNSVATPPRFIAPGRTVHLTIRAVSRQHRFAPTKKVVESIEYIFWHCVDRYGVSIHEMEWMSNHAHIVLTDEHGVLPKFVCKLNSLISRQLNAIRGLKGTNIEKGYVDQEIVGEDALLRLCAYTLANPCAAGLVERSEHWKGVSSLHREYGETFQIKRPRFGLWKSYYSRKTTRLPKTVTGKLVRPRVHLHRSDQEIRAEIRAQTEVLASRASDERRRNGQRVLGWQRAKRVKWNQVAATFEALRELNPTGAYDTTEQMLDHLGRTFAFRMRYKREINVYIYDCPTKAVFPYETWRMPKVYLANYDPIPTR